MTMREAEIKITGVQVLGDERDVTVMEVGGFCGRREGVCRITYIEKPDKDMEVANQIEVSSEKAVISKSGAVESEMVFVPGEKSSVAYRTPFGVIDMTICCEEVIVKEEECRSEIRIVYDLCSGGQLVAHCSTDIEVELIS